MLVQVCLLNMLLYMVIIETLLCNVTITIQNLVTSNTKVKTLLRQYLKRLEQNYGGI